nr:hypothetical protein [Tanacetum cinerariifolium]
PRNAGPGPNPRRGARGGRHVPGGGQRQPPAPRRHRRGPGPPRYYAARVCPAPGGAAPRRAAPLARRPWPLLARSSTRRAARSGRAGRQFAARIAGCRAGQKHCRTLLRSPHADQWRWRGG